MDYRIPMNNTEKSYLFQLAYSKHDEIIERLRIHDVNNHFVSIPPKLDGELMASVTELVLEGLTCTEPIVLEKKSLSEFGLHDSNE